MSLMDQSLAFYARHGTALFPIPAGRKAPQGIVGSFKHDHSSDPAQWAAWRQQHPNCNFGVVAFASQWITLDTDIKPVEGQTPEDARAEAWSMRAELFESWGMAPDTIPHVNSPHGGWHDYFAVPPHIDASTLRQPDAIKKRINVRVIGYTVAAGSYYDGTERNDAPGWYQLFDSPAPPHPAPQALLDHCARAERVAPTIAPGSYDKGDVAGLVDWLDGRGGFDAYEDWCSIGMALKLEYGDDGKDLWAHSHNETVTADVIETKWNSFASDPTAHSVTINSFMKRAHELGWTGTLRPSLNSMFGGVAQLSDVPPIAPAPMALGDIPLPQNPADEENAANEAAHPTPAGGFVKTLGQSLSGFLPPDYLIDGILQRRFCYALTAQTGVGKTTVAMRLAAHVAIGKPVGEIEVERGTVIYFAGENPTDVQMRWLGLCKEMNLDPNALDVHIIEGSMHLSKVVDRIIVEVIANDITAALVVVDTAAAYFEEDNDNDNVQAGNHARRLRALTLLPGGPCVLVLCHPTKNAQDDQLVPRGGGAFLNEVDGNIALRRDGDTITAFALGKFRGPEFPAINFALKVVRDHPQLKDTKGRQIPTIIALPISAAEQERIEITLEKNEDKILELLCNEPGLKVIRIAERLRWKGHARASIILKKLATEKLVECTRGLWSATPKGQKAMNLVASAAATPDAQPRAPITPANLGGAAFPMPARPVTPPPMPPAQ